MIFYYHRLNRYSFHALAGALDCDSRLADLPVAAPRTAEELKAAVAERIGKKGSAVVAFSILTPQFEEIRRLVSELRAAQGSRLTALGGGPHASAAPREVLDAGMDVVFRGEAEAVFPRLVGRLLDNEDFRDLEGIAFRTGNEIRLNERARPVDIDSFPSFSPRRSMFGPIEITRGCPFACSFCQTSHIFGGRPRHRSVANIVRQARTLATKNGPVVRLLSPNAFSYGSPDGIRINLSAIDELLASLRDAVGRKTRIIFGYFPSEVRPEQVTPETLSILRRYADNDEIVIGAQSGSDRMLDACHRSHSAESVFTAVSLARRHGYKVIVDFILGLPGETAEDVRKTIDLMSRLARLGARIHPHAFVPLPQTAFAAARPGVIPAEVVRLLAELARSRAVYGDWIEQRRLAGRVWRALRKGGAE